MKKPSIKELSQQVTRKEIPQQKPKISKLKLFVLKLFGIKLKPDMFVVGDLLKRKTSDNPRELYEVKQNLFDSNLDRVILLHDMQKNQIVTVYELDFGSFTTFKGVVPGTMVNPNDI